MLPSFDQGLKRAWNCILDRFSRYGVLRLMNKKMFPGITDEEACQMIQKSRLRAVSVTSRRQVDLAVFSQTSFPKTRSRTFVSDEFHVWREERTKFWKMSADSSEND